MKKEKQIINDLKEISNTFNERIDGMMRRGDDDNGRLSKVRAQGMRSVLHELSDIIKKYQ